MAQDYKDTLHMPKTAFPMRGNLPKREPATQQMWDAMGLYDLIMQKNAGRERFIFHDGPPYANGTIHLGTALNKVLKDFIVRHRNMTGYYAPYVPGWDTHGLPIELKAMKELGADKGSIPPVELRRHCKEFALKHVENQKAQFKRLGSIGDYDHPYLTLRPEYEARQVEVFGKMAKDGYMYKGLKPVYWCPDCNTALAEAEIEYENDPCKSIYVKFRVSDDKGVFSARGLDASRIFFVIWTTTTWTIPGNLAICLGPEYDYTLVKVGDEYYVMARELVASVMEAAGIENYETLYEWTGAELEGIRTKHPLYDRESPVIVGDHVTLESGTGCVHTAPGYGVEDFEVCKKYDDIGIVVCVDEKGRQTAEAGEFEGLNTDEANERIAQRLVEEGAMLAMQDIVHQYPHCWRCHSPIIYRATEQWFCSVKGFREDALRAIEDVRWIPAWGEDRIKGMVRDRSDWCISRQRIWGVPIPVVYCKVCRKPIITDETIASIAEVFRKEGSDAWWTKDVTELLPKNLVCECGCREFTKEYDIMDVWFDSGVSHTAVLDNYEELSWPADLYLEGADQYRGWFQSSLLTSVVYRGRAPYREVCTHGWVVDGEGRIMHKSLGNGIAPEEIIEQYGADILRLWVASSDYHSDIRVSTKILRQQSDAYRKIRNTARFMLGNFCDGETVFSPDTDSVPDEALEEIDRWMLLRLDEVARVVKAAYTEYEFHTVVHALHNFCVTDLSSFYLDILKDRLYCEAVDSATRRAAQTTMFRILDTLVRMMAPILCFTAEEIWQEMPHRASDDARSVFLNDFLPETGLTCEETLREKWETIARMREDVNKRLEEKRAEKFIGKSLEASVTITIADEALAQKASAWTELADVLIVSEVKVQAGEVNAEAPGATDGTGGLMAYAIERASGEMCARCWKYDLGVGADARHPDVCPRCARVLG